MIIMKAFVFIAFLSSSNSKSNFMPNLPLGEYRIVFEKMYSCESMNIFQYYFYFSKTTLTKTELKGNYTFLIPFDDSFTFDLNVASWGSTGGWKPNSMVYIAKNGCSTFKKVMGNVWYTVVKAFNITSYDCPIQAGTHMTNGIDLKELDNFNMPKVYFYGKYKVTFKIRNEEKNVFGCIVLEITLIRPWEKPF
ncbi:uncharacterized protein LOC114122513 [Aphis gossypii]|uniref:uncharacterized protein LOC114122513 n=1 Tax=Aphis gossypii TaxID=80765 RepID=UPI002158D54C|nr:uncharacterized protein LOC114122513 [Aphis gossypii]